MIYQKINLILKILIKNGSQFRMSFFFPWIGIFISTIMLVLIDSIMDGMKNEIFNKLENISSQYIISSESDIYLDKVENFLLSNNIQYDVRISRDVIISNNENYVFSKLIASDNKIFEKNTLMIGAGIAGNLNLSLYDTTTIFSPLDIKFSSMITPSKSFIVDSIYAIPVIDFDQTYVFTNINSISEFVNGEKTFSIKGDINQNQIQSLEKINSNISVAQLKKVCINLNIILWI